MTEHRTPPASPGPRDDVRPVEGPGDYGRIVRVVQAHTGINRAFIMGRRRDAPIADARALAMYLSYHMNPRSSSIMVGRYFGRDHTTVLTAIAKIEDVVASSTRFAEQVAALQRGLEA